MKDIFACICIHLSIRFPGSRLSSTKPALHKWIMVVMMMMVMWSFCSTIILPASSSSSTAAVIMVLTEEGGISGQRPISIIRCNNALLYGEHTIHIVKCTLYHSCDWSGWINLSQQQQLQYIKNCSSVGCNTMPRAVAEVVSCIWISIGMTERWRDPEFQNQTWIKNPLKEILFQKRTEPVTSTECLELEETVGA